MDAQGGGPRFKQTYPWIRDAWIVLAAIGFGLCIHLALWRWIGGGFTFLPLLFSVVIAAWAGNGAAGVVTAVLSAVAVAVLTFEPLGSLAVASPYDLLRLVLFLVLALSISAVCAGLHRARRRILAQSLEAERTRDEALDLHRRFQTALEAGQMTIWDWNLDTNQIVRSESAKAMYGLDGEPIERFYALMHPDDRPVLEQAVRTAVETGAGYERQFRVGGADSGWRWIASRGRVRRHPETGHRHLTGSAVDISDLVGAQAAVRESERGFRQMADSISQLAWTARPDGTIEWFNQRWLDYTGASAEQFGAHGWQLVVEPSALPSVVQAWQSALEKGVDVELTFPLRGTDGAFRPFLMKLVALRGDRGDILRWFGTHTDISHQVALEVQRREEDRRTDAFLASLAHELRNPLAPLRNGLEALRRLSPGAEDWRRTHAMMDRQMGHVSRLLDDMLDVARIRHSKFQLGRERMFVSRALQIAVETVQPFVENAGQKLLVEEIDPGLEVDGDPFRLCQAFDNLLNNASKFSPRNSTITVEVRKNGFQAEVRFRDSGVGISAHEQPFVFDLFWQSPGESPNLRRGLGIGLALTRSIVELHGGTIVVESRGPGLGSTFIVRLPLAVPAHEPDAPAPLVRETASRRARVLVIDDNRDAAESLEQLVRMEGHDVIVAFDGPAGLSIAQEHPPDLVILDIGMPGMDGYEVCRQLRQRDWGADPLIAALSGWGQPEDRRRSQAAGFNVHFVKPLEHAQLLELLRMASERNASPESEDGPCASPIRSLTIDTRRLQDSPLSDPISFDGAAALGAPAEEAQGDAPG